MADVKSVALGLVIGAATGLGGGVAASAQSLRDMAPTVAPIGVQVGVDPENPGWARGTIQFIAKPTPKATAQGMEAPAWTERTACPDSVLETIAAQCKLRDTRAVPDAYLDGRTRHHLESDKGAWFETQ